jgi:hypothetical protein
VHDYRRQEPGRASTLANQARKTADSSIVQSKGVSSYKPEEPDTKVWRNSSHYFGNYDVILMT